MKTETSPNFRRRTPWLFRVLLTGAMVPPLHAGDWPMWGRDVSRNMASTETGISIDFDPGEHVEGTDRIDLDTVEGIRWVAKLGSQSYGNAAIAEGKVVVGTNNESPRDPEITEDRGIVICFDEETGKFEWQLNIPKLGAGKVSDWEYIGICSSPAIVDGHVYISTNRCEVVKIDLDGLADGNDGDFQDEAAYKGAELADWDADLVWLYDMRDELGVFPHNVTGGSPLIVGDRVYASTTNGVDWSHTNIPAPFAPSLAVFNRQSGELVGEEASGISQRVLHATWSSPSFGVFEGQEIVVFGAGDGFVYGYNPETEVSDDGFDVLPELWRMNMNPESYRFDDDGQPIRYATFFGPSEVICTPVIYEGLVYVNIGQDPEHGDGVGRMVCIDPTKRGDISESGVVWDYRGIGRSMSTPSIADDLVFVAEYAGKLHCLDAKTGEHFWTHDTRSRIWGSTLVADGKVFLGTEEGDLHILDATKEYNVLRTVNFGAPIYSTPVVANGTLYIGTQTHLYAIDGETPKAVAINVPKAVH
ncbi:MAG: PQQ-binding-like beta-propeller repeat protein [Opitutales bacterium]